MNHLIHNVGRLEPIEEGSLIAKLRDAYVAKPVESEHGYEVDYEEFECRKKENSKHV